MRTLVLEVGELHRGSYPVTLLADDGRDSWLAEPVAHGSAPGDLGLPLELSGGTLATAGAIREAFLAAPSASRIFDEIGDHLGAFLLRGDVRAAVDEQARLFSGEGQATEGLRLLLRIQPTELRRLPWELLRWRRGPLPAFADERNPCARLHALESAATEPDQCWPMLRVLVVVGSRDEDVETAEEIECLRGALVRHTGFIDLDVRYRPQREELVKLCCDSRPHILHFIGHGHSGALEFAPEGDRPGWDWRTGDIVRDLQDAVPRLVVLNACRSAEVGDQSEAWDIVEALFQLNVPAIVGMQGDIDGSAAAAFGGALYRALIHGRCIDAAVAIARNEMSYVVPFDSRDVWLPTLTLSEPPERVLPQQYGVSPAECQTIVDGFKERHECEIYAFVDRVVPRRKLWRGIGVELQRPQRGGAMAIVGPSLIGKSALAKWCVGTMELRGGNAAYVPLGGDHTLRATELLGAVAEALADSELHRAANMAAFDAYVEHVDRLQGERGAPPAGDAWGTGRYVRTIKPGRETIVAEVFEAFRIALERAAGDQEIVIAIDDPGMVEQAYWDQYVVPLLLAPIAERALPVHLILVGERPVYERLVDRRLRARVPAIELDRLEPEEFVPLATQHLAACGYDADDLQSLVEVVGANVQRNGRWGGEHFALLQQFARTLGGQPETWTSTH